MQRLGVRGSDRQRLTIAAEQGRRPKVLAPDALELLREHRWPGNVRELENVLRATTVFAEGETITVSDLLAAGSDLRRASDSRPPASRAPVSQAGHARPAANGPTDQETGSEALGRSPLETPSEPKRPLTAAAYAHVREHRVSLHDVKRQIERECVIRALEESNGNITRAAELLGMKRPRVSQLVKQYGLSATPSEDEG